MPITELLVMFYAVSALRRYTAALSDASFCLFFPLLFLNALSK